MNASTISPIARVTDALRVDSPELDELIFGMRRAKWFCPFIAMVVASASLLDESAHRHWPVAIGLTIGLMGFGGVTCYDVKPRSLRALYLMIDGALLSVGLFLTAGMEEVIRTLQPNTYWLIERYWYAYMVAGVAAFLYSAMCAPWVRTNRITMAKLASYLPRTIPASDLFRVMFPTAESRRGLRNKLVSTATGGGLGIFAAIEGNHGHLVLFWIPSLLVGSVAMGVAFGHLASFFHAFGVHDLQILHLPTTPPLPWHTRLRENFRALWYPARIAFLAGLFASGLLAVGGIAEGHGLWWALVFPTVWTLGAAIILLPGRRSLFVGLAMVGWIAVCLPLVLVVIAVALA